MEKLTGDIIDLAFNGKIDAIAHGCNCFNTFGAGLARQIRERLPKAYSADLSTKKGDKGKLGTYSFAEAHVDPRVLVFNCYTQYMYGSPKNGEVYVDYGAVASSFRALNSDPSVQELRIGIPKIGAGLAGGDWQEIEGIILQNTPDINITLVELPTA